MRKNNNYISDNGVVQKQHIVDKIVIAACSIISLVLIYLGIMAYWVV